MLNLAQIYGLTDQAAAALVANGVAYDALLEKIAANAMFGLVNPEVFYAEVANGDAIPLPVSQVDGYQYSRLETQLIGVLRDSADPLKGSPSLPGPIALFASGFDAQQAESALASSRVDYRSAVTVGAQLSRDGTQAVWLVGTRGWSDLSLATSPALTDVLASNFAQDAPIAQTALRGVNENSRLAAVRPEIFMNSAVPITTISRSGGVVTANTARAHGFGVGSGIFVAQINRAQFNSSGSLPCFTITAVPTATQLQWNQPGPDDSGIGGRLQLCFYQNGSIVPLPISPADGYAYARSEIIYFPSFLATVGSGVNMSRIILSVNATTGAVSSEVDYWNGSAVTVTSDGNIHIMQLARRTLAAISTIQSPVVAVDESKVFATRLYDAPTMQQLNINAKAGVLSPEFFGPTNFTNAQTVGLPVSPVDGYTYTRGQLQYMYWMTDSGVAPATSHAIRRLNFAVNQQTGVVSSVTTYADDTTGNDVVTNQGTLAVITVGRRG